MPRLLAEELHEGAWEPIEYRWTAEQSRPDTIARLAADVADARGAIGADLPLAGTELVDRPVVRLRAPLVDAEVQRYRLLGADAGRALGDLCRSLRPGSTEVSVARRVGDAAMSIGGRCIVTLVAGDDRIARFRHPVPTRLAWQRTIMAAACIQRDGLVVALSRLVCAGEPPADLMSRTRATASVFRALLDATRPGATGRDLFAVATRAYERAGFAGEEARHHQGGATGYRSREWLAHPDSEEQVQTAQAFAWNPSITGTKVEDTALLTADGIEPITGSPGWPLLEGCAADLLRVD
jgi:antitoxin VapB